MRAFSKKIAVLGLIAASLAACTPTGTPYQSAPQSVSQTGPKQTAGALTGAVLGGVAGSQFGKGDGKLVAVGVGTLLGAMMGSSVGASLDRADALYAQQASMRALETGRTNVPVTWKNPDTGNSGTFVPTRTYENTSGVCREFTHTVYIGGKAERGYGTACRQSDGSWQIQ